MFPSCLYSVLSICLPLLHALFSCFTASLPNLTVSLLIRRSVSQAVLSLCLSIHLLSVYLHLRKKTSPGWHVLSSSPPTLSTLLSVRLPGFWFLRSICSFVIIPCLQHVKQLFPYRQKIQGLVYEKFSLPSVRWLLKRCFYLLCLFQPHIATMCDFLHSMPAFPNQEWRVTCI